MRLNLYRQRFLALLALSLPAAALAQEQSATDFVPVVAPVKLLPVGSQPSASPASDGVMPTQEPPAPRPTLPGGKLPQYQLPPTSRTSLSADKLEDARVRLLLALPSRPVLVESQITIDGRPFRMAREHRIAEILQALQQPLPPPEIPADTQDANSDTAPDDIQTDQDDTDDEQQPDDDAEQPEREPVAPPTTTPYSLAGTATEFLLRYAAATGIDPSADEIRWLLANWSDGPVVLMLKDNFQRFRARERPVFEVLDRDRDGAVAADELNLAVQSFNECDRNRDQVVDAIEVSESAHARRSPAPAQAEIGAMLFAVPSDDKAAADSTFRRIAARYRSGEFTADDLRILYDGTPDLKLAVSFDTADPTNSTITLTAVGGVANDNQAQATAIDAAIALPLAGETVVFSAVQGEGSDQVSLGAVSDGYPILPEIDPNDDGRFTIRELRRLVADLKQLDRNGDGSLTADEVRAPVRVCFGLGPLVHRELAGIRTVNRGPATPVVEGPDWFVRMDRNRDRDLTRSEFSGNDEQFATLDADGDKLVSAAEALEFDQASRNNDAPADPQPNAASPSETE